MSRSISVDWRTVAAELVVTCDGERANAIALVSLATPGLDARDAGDFMAAVGRCCRWLAGSPESAALTPAEIVSVFCELGGDFADLQIARALEAADLSPKRGKSS